MKLKTSCAIAALIVIIASLLANYTHSAVGVYALFPGVVIKIWISGNAHGGGFLSSVIMYTGAWLVWWFVLYLGVEIVLKIPHGKKVSTCAEVSKASRKGSVMSKNSSEQKNPDDTGLKGQ